MAQQTAVELLFLTFKELSKAFRDADDIASANLIDFLCEREPAAKAIEKDQIIRAIIYALDEDGHTGDWKIKFANDYYNKLNKGYDIRN